METMQRSPERLAVLSQFYLCWCFIALICGIVMDGLLTDYGLSYCCEPFRANRRMQAGI